MPKQRSWSFVRPPEQKVDPLLQAVVLLNFSPAKGLGRKVGGAVSRNYYLSRTSRN